MTISEPYRKKEKELNRKKISGEPKVTSYTNRRKMERNQRKTTVIFVPSILKTPRFKTEKITLKQDQYF